jgi:hypothetical protein
VRVLTWPLPGRQQAETVPPTGRMRPSASTGPLRAVGLVTRDVRVMKDNRTVINAVHVGKVNLNQHCSSRAGGRGPGWRQQWQLLRCRGCGTRLAGAGRAARATAAASLLLVVAFHMLLLCCEGLSRPLLCHLLLLRCTCLCGPAPLLACSCLNADLQPELSKKPMTI